MQPRLCKSVMPRRRNWQEPGTEWVQIVRNWKTPQKKPDAKGRQDAGKGRRDSQVGGQVSGVQRGPSPEEVLSNASARVTKLEAAMAAVGDSDPTHIGCKTP